METLLHTPEPIDWERLGRQHAVLAMGEVSPLDLMQSRLRTMVITDDEYEIAWLLACETDWIGPDGTKAEGANPGMLALCRGSDLEPVRVMELLDQLHAMGLVRPCAEGRFYLDLTGVRWEAWKAQLGYSQVEIRTITPPWVDKALGRDGEA